MSMEAMSLPGNSGLTGIQLPRRFRGPIRCDRMTLEATYVTGIDHPGHRRSRENVPVRLEPEWIVERAAADALHGGKTLEQEAHMGAASRAEVDLQYASMVG